MELHTSTNTFGGDASTRKCRQKVGFTTGGFQTIPMFAEVHFLPGFAGAGFFPGFQHFGDFQSLLSPLKGFREGWFTSGHGGGFRDVPHRGQRL